MTILKNVGLVVIVLVLSWLLAEPVGRFYGDFFQEGLGSFIDAAALAGLVPSYIFFLTLVITSWGTLKKYIWIAVLLLPALAFVIYFDLSRIWFYILVGIVGWVLGFGIKKLLSKNRTF